MGSPPFPPVSPGPPQFTAPPASRPYPTPPSAGPYLGYGVTAPPIVSMPSASAPPPQRPGVVATASTLAITASLQWVCVLAFAWLVAVAAVGNLGVEGPEGAVYHLFNRLQERMLDGLAWPLFGFPLASFVTGFLVLAQRPWTRVAHTVVGVAALAWSAWWLHANLVWWLVPATYILLACLILWTPAATRWYRWGRHAPGAGGWPGPGR
ncbi:MAG: hypothetical protein ACLGIF_01155 [Actinomycetes bacterium]